MLPTAPVSGVQPARTRAPLSRVLSTIALLAVAVGAWYASHIGFEMNVKVTPAIISNQEGLAYTAQIRREPRWPLTIEADGMESPRASEATLSEDDVQLGPSHSIYTDIVAQGRGSFSHWGKNLYFSSSDGSDPRTNGRRYKLSIPSGLPLAWALGILGAAIAALALVWRSAIRTILAEIQERMKGKGAKRATVGLLVWVIIGSGVGLAIAYLPMLMSGALLWIAFGVILASGVMALGRILKLLRACFGRHDQSMWAPNAALVCLSAAITCAGLELYLGYSQNSARQKMQNAYDAADGQGESTGQDADAVLVQVGRAEIELPRELIAAMETRRSLLTLPKDWELQPVTIPDTRWAFRWHGVLHIHDENGFRRYTAPFPAKTSGTFRILVVGDSMTYGDGVEEKWRYSSQLLRLLEKDYRVDVISLGADGAQSEDILRNIETFVPIVKPDLVIYGVCNNDFLPSGVGQYSNLEMPLPDWLKRIVRRRTLLGPLASDSYSAVLLLAGVSVDFHDDILKDFNGYQQRFARDVMRMNQVVRSAGLPPILGMSLDQFAILEGRGHQISRIAERAMRQAGFDVISLEGFYKKYDGQRFVVSRWEAHPNEEAYAIFAAMLADHLYDQTYLEQYKRGGGTNTGTVNAN